ncbi:hypothetical protein [Fibrella aquatica]|uniref:hypothetical protein n=1 Tax=Fibrella aquatica TaxID=3242487 RepID=UPI003522D69E
MEDYTQKTGWVTWLLGGLTILLLGGGYYVWNQNKTLIRQSDLSKRAADSLVSVKFHLEGDVRKLEQELQSAIEAKTAIDSRLSSVENQLAQRNRIVTQLTRTGSNRRQTIQALNQNLETLTVGRDSLTNQMNAMREKIGWLTDSGTVYRNRSLQLADDIAQLNTTLLTMVPRSDLRSDLFRVEAVKSNKKETAKAKKINALTVSLNVPANTGLSGQQEVYLAITNGEKKAALPPLRSLTVMLPTVNEVVEVNAVQSVQFGSNSQRIVFHLDSVADLKPGLYRASVYTKDTYLGSVEFSFRDSFWFF